MRSFFVGSVLVAASFAVAFASSNDARADVVIGGDFNIAAPLSVDDYSKLGFGFDARAGYRLGLGPVFVQPEVQFGYLSFNTDVDGFTGNLMQITAGGHVGLQGLVQPSAFVHLGYGRLSSSGPSDITDGESLASAGLLIDAGLALDIKIPYVSFGGEVGFTDLTGDAGFKFIHFGPEAHVIF